MAEIIKKNSAPAFEKKVTCHWEKDGYGFSYGEKEDFCGSELKINKSDIKKHKWYKYPEMSGTDYGFICPVCGMFTVLPENDLPRHVKEDAEEVFLERGRLRGWHGSTV